MMMGNFTFSCFCQWAVHGSKFYTSTGSGCYSIANWNGPFHRPDRHDTVCGGLEPLELMVPIALTLALEL